MKFTLLSLFTTITLLVNAQNPQAAYDYIEKYYKVAVSEMERTGVPACITMAQGILESGNGNSELSLKSNNHFGIKCKSNWTGEKVYHDDDERGECFRKYNNVEESYKDHSDFLRAGEHYAFLFNIDKNDYKAWAHGLRKAGYATSPKYAYQLIELIERYDLANYKGAPAKTEDLSKTNTEEKENNNDLDNQASLDKVIYINTTKAILAKAGTSLLAIAEKYKIDLSTLLDINDKPEKSKDIIDYSQIIFLQRKRKQGAFQYHIVKNDETVYDIAQTEGIRLESLLSYNELNENEKPEIGQKLFLQTKAPTKVKVISK